MEEQANINMKLAKQEFRQEMHCCGQSADEASVTMELHDGGGGEYLVIDAYQFAFNDEAEIDEFVKHLKQMMASARK